MYTAVMVWTALGGGPFAAVPIAAMLIATLGVLSYFLLVRHIMRGPMLAQILGTFGLALFLRYAAFWTFGANFKTLPDTLVGGSFVLGGIRFEALAPAGRRRAGCSITLLLHLHPDAHRRSAAACWPSPRTRRRRSSWASGPQRMQALAWALAGARDRHRRRADRQLLLHLADGRRDARHHRLRHRLVRRLRQRAGRAGGRPDHRRRSKRCRPI